MIAGMQTKNAKGYPKMLAHLKHYTAVSCGIRLLMLRSAIETGINTALFAVLKGDKPDA